MPKAKVCMLTVEHPALDARIFYKESLSLQRAGYEVTLIAPLDHEGFLFDSGRKRIATGETTIQDIRIIGFRDKRSLLGKVQTALSLLSLVSLGRIRLGSNRYADLIDKGIKLRADVYHCHEVWSLYAGIQIKRELEKQGIRPKLIYDVHEFNAAGPEARTQIMGRILTGINVRYEKRALKYVDYVVTVNQIIRGYLLTLNRFIQTEVIYNCAVPSFFREPEANGDHKNRITICHEGSLGFNRGLKQMVEVMKMLKECYDGKVELLIIGDVYGKEREYLEEKLAEYELHDTINCSTWLPYEQVGEAISSADIGIIFFEPTRNNMFGTPNKLFNYMRYGLPVVSVDIPEISRIIRETKCGLIVKDRSTMGLVKALSALIDDEDRRRQMGENARRAVHNQYSWEHMEKRLLRVYTELIS